MIFDPDQLSRCVGCGLCLTACPTYDTTQLEVHGPRGRIAAMRLVQRGEIDPANPEYRESMETCVQCRACEVACPSDVEFGALMETARADLTSRPGTGAIRTLATRTGLATLTRPRMLRAMTFGLAAAQRLRMTSVLPDRLRMSRRVVRRREHTASPRAGDRAAYLFRGCVMDTWFADVHDATVVVLERAGYVVHEEPSPSCCGALHLHAGDQENAHRLLQNVVTAYASTSGPVVVNSAGCGAALKEAGRVLGTSEALAFAARVVDVSEAVTPDDLPDMQRLELTVAYQSACHLANVQRVGDAPLTLLRGVPGLVVHDDPDGLCCGAGGAYSALQPWFAQQMGQRKAARLEALGADVVASGNPGCTMHLANHGLRVLHPVQLVAAALDDRVRAAVLSVCTSR